MENYIELSENCLTKYKTIISQRQFILSCGKQNERCQLRFPNNNAHQTGHMVIQLKIFTENFLSTVTLMCSIYFLIAFIGFE